MLELTEQAAQLIVDNDKPVLIVGENKDLNFEALRIKYHLLPIPAHVRKGASTSDMPRMTTDHVLVVRSPVLAPGEIPFVAGSDGQRNQLKTEPSL